jgi:hypothetical protein
MSRALLTCLLVSGLIAGCANGWPRKHDPPRIAGNCAQTASRIERGTCASTSPANQTSGADIDRGGQGAAPNAIRMPVRSNGGP